MKIVVTIPAYNEERKIGEVIDRIKSVMKKRKYNFKILVVNDGSRDRTREIAENKGAVVYSNSVNLGLAESFRIEMKECIKMGADIIVHIDADGQYLPEEIPRLIDEFKQGYDLVLGSRFKGTIEQMPWIKKWGNRAFSRVVSYITRKRITDCQTGFRIFSRKLAQSVELVSNHTYTQEQIIKAVKDGFKVCEVPIHFARRKGRSRLIKNPFEYAFKAWINLFRIYRDYEPLKFFGKFGFLLMIPSFLIGIYFVILHITYGIRGHLGLFFLMILLFFSGLQIMVFGFLADMIKK